MTGAVAAVLASGQNIVYVPGLVRKLYFGYAGTNTAYFDSTTPYSTSINTAPIAQSWSTGAFEDEDYSGLWIGYYRPVLSGITTFAINISGTRYSSVSYLWIGSTARSGYAANNALISAGSSGGSAGTSLLAGVSYPIRIQVGYRDTSDIFNSNMSFFLAVNSSTSYPVFYNSLTQGF
jgi:hypothetical protein